MKLIKVKMERKTFNNMYIEMFLDVSAWLTSVRVEITKPIKSTTSPIPIKHKAITFNQAN